MATTKPPVSLLRGAGLVAAAAMLAGCTGSGPTPAASSPGTRATSSEASGPTGAAPTTETPWTPGPGDVNLPAPPDPTSPAPSRAGSLALSSMPVPAGWRAVAAKGGVEEGFLGNGTPAHARDPRYAAYEMMAVGCREVDRSAWTDPLHALEVSLAKGSQTGVADAMTFASPTDAQQWFRLWQEQMAACQAASNPATTTLSSSNDTRYGRRSYGSGDDWADVAAVSGATVRLYVLSDPARTVTAAQQQALAAQLTAAR